MKRYGLFILRGLLKVSQTENKSESFKPCSSLTDFRYISLLWTSEGRQWFDGMSSQPEVIHSSGSRGAPSFIDDKLWPSPPIPEVYSTNAAAGREEVSLTVCLETFPAKSHCFFVWFSD